jgi:hypothetical protein
MLRNRYVTVTSRKASHSARMLSVHGRCVSGSVAWGNCQQVYGAPNPLSKMHGTIAYPIPYVGCASACVICAARCALPCSEHMVDIYKGLCDEAVRSLAAVQSASCESHLSVILFRASLWWLSGETVVAL